MEVEEGEPTDLGMVLPPSTVRQWLLVGILRGEIIAHISELRTLNLPFGLGFYFLMNYIILVCKCSFDHKNAIKMAEWQSLTGKTLNI